MELHKSMTDERRENNDRILSHMGKVDQYMKDDALFKENYLKQLNACADQTRENTKAIIPLQTKMSAVIWGGGAFVATGLSVAGRWAYKHFS